MSGFVRPPAELDKLLAAWQLWADQSEMPGRTMADLKIAGLDVILEDLAGQSDSGAAMFAPWQAWEKGKTTPEVALAALEEAGISDLISALDPDAQNAES